MNEEVCKEKLAKEAFYKQEMKRIFRIFLGRKFVVFGIIVLVLFVLVALLAPLLAPYNPNATDMMKILAKPSVNHLLGTDTVGRDIFSRIIYGSRTSLIVSVVAVLFAAVIGMALGLVAGFYGGFASTVIMRIMDAIMSVPAILLAITISALLKGGIKNVIIAIGVSLIPSYARLMRSQVMVVKQHDYIVASKAYGAKNIRTMLSHILPNCFPPLIVLITMQVGHAILSEASLSFIGVGISPPTAAWGSMVSDGYQQLLRAPILSIAPGLAIMLAVFAFNMVGDGLRDALDPRLKNTL